MAPDGGDEDLELLVLTLEDDAFVTITRDADVEPYRRSHPRATAWAKINMTQDFRCIGA